jgi:hypothetical protein
VKPVALGLAALVTTYATASGATPSRWSLARSDAAYREDVAGRAAEENLIESASQRRRERDPLADPKTPVRAALVALEAGKITKASSLYPRQLLARTLQGLSRWADAVPVWESILRDPEAPDVFRSDALSEVAIAYARVGRQEDETRAYDGALALEEGGGSAHMLPIDWPSGGRMTMLANQAEAFMVQGDVERAIAGYRASLDAVDSTIMGLAYSPTALWSLGVALDRAGDLAGGLESIALARSYDPSDARIKGPSWFFVPSYDEHYYWALGHWLVARGAPDQDDRIAAYERCVRSWATFLASAPESDPYVPIARARLRVASKEHEALRKLAATPTPIDPKQPAQP